MVFMRAHVARLDARLPENFSVISLRLNPLCSKMALTAMTHNFEISRQANTADVN